MLRSKIINPKFVCLIGLSFWVSAAYAEENEFAVTALRPDRGITGHQKYSSDANYWKADMVVTRSILLAKRDSKTGEETLSVAESAAQKTNEGDSMKSVPVLGDAAFKSTFRRPTDPPSDAQRLLQKALEARSPRFTYHITPLPLNIDRWSFFEATLLEVSDIATERFVVDSKQGVVTAGDMKVLGAIYRTLDILDAGTTNSFNLARIASYVSGSRAEVLSTNDLSNLPRPGGMTKPTFIKNAGGAQLVFWEERSGRGRSYKRCQVDLAKDYSVTLNCVPYVLTP